MVYDVSGSSALPQPAKDTTIDQVANALRNAGSAMSDTQVISQTAVVEGWVGESANQYVSDVNEIKTAVEGAQTSIESSAQALVTYQTEFTNLKAKITAHQTTWDDDLKTYKEAVAAQEADRENARNESAQNDPGGTFDSSSWDNEISKLKTNIENKQKESAKLYNAVVEAVDSAASTAANSINAALEVYIPGISSGEAAAVTPNRSDLGVTMFGGGTGLLAAQTKWEDAMTDAPQAARLLNQTDPNTGLPTEAALKKFNEKYGNRLASDPYFASALLNKIGAEKLYSIAGKSTDQNIPASYVSALKSFTENVGAGIILATGGNSTQNTEAISNFNSVDKALSIDGKTSVESWRSKFQGDLISNGQKKYSHDGEVITENRTQISYLGYELLGQYIGHGAKAHPELSLGDDFLNGVNGENAVGKAMVKWDAEHPRNFDLINASASSGPSGTAELKYGKNGMFRDGLSWDYLQNMYEAMDNNPDDTPAQKFMNSTLKWDDDHNGDTPDKEMNMTRYLVGNRTQVGKPGDLTLYWPDDKGEALGRLINEISGDRSNKDSVNIASNFLEGYNDGISRNYDDGWRFGNQDKVEAQDIFGYRNSNMRNWAGQILSPYADDIAQYLDDPSNKNGVHLPENSNRYQLMFDSKMQSSLLAKDGIIADLAWDKGVDGRAPAREVLLASTMVKSDQAFSEGFASNSPTKYTDLRDKIQNYSKLYEALYEVPGANETALHNHIAERNKNIQSVINAGVGMIPWGDVITDKGAEYVFNQVKTNGLSPALNEAFPTKIKEYDPSNANNSVENLMRDQLERIRYENYQHSHPEATPWNELSADEREYFKQGATNPESKYYENGTYSQYKSEIWNNLTGDINDAKEENAEAGK